ncbi:hypothetical protein, partial [Serratia marcescens]|uniref:hypothetical protein n=1 Tax=Serratia marcescens TaxID=615 RepID=UPI0011150B37
MAFAPGDPFINAKQTVSAVRSAVLDLQEAAIEQAFAARDASRAVLEQMGDFAPRLMFNANAPIAPRLNVSFGGSLRLPELSGASFGSVARPAPQQLALNPLPAIPPINIDEFVPSYTAINTLTAPDLPTRELGVVPPTLEQIDVPVPPTLERPLLPSLDAISIP